MIYLPSDNSHSELVRTFRLLQEALNSKIPTTQVIDKTVTKNIINNVQPATAISVVDKLQFNTSFATPTFSTGQLYWNQAEGTLDMNTDIIGTTLSIGQEQYVRVVNKTGSLISDGQVVYINDAQGNRPTIALAKADSISTSMIIGVATNDIANNAEGYVTTLGVVRGYNTSSFTDGDRLYLSAATAGALTATPPTGSAYVIHVATALNSTVNGSIFVHPGEPVAVDPSFVANTDLAPASQKAIRSYVGHDVTGEFTGFDVPENVTVSYDSTTRKVTLTGSFNAYYHGVKVTALTNGWVSDAHPVATAPYFLYYDGTNFVWSTTPWGFDKLMICVAVWNSAGTFIYALRECHGLMQWQAHRELHETTGTYLKSGGDLSSYVLSSTTAANRRPDIASTHVADEDLITTNAALTSKLYSHHTLTGTGTSTFTTGNAEILPVTGSQPYYNQFSSPNWVQTAVSNNTYTTAFCIAIPVTNDAGSQSYRYIWIQGQSEGTLAQMQAVTFGSLNLGQLSSLTPEFVPIAKAIIRYQGGNWTIEQVEKLTVSRVSGVSTSGNFLSAVTTDASLTGAGTAGSALSVARSSTVPVVNGTAAVGTSDASSRSDHVHPTDTSRAADSAVVHNTGNETGLAGNKTWTGIATFSNSTASTSTTTGAVVITGGVGIGGAVNIGGAIAAASAAIESASDVGVTITTTGTSNAAFTRVKSGNGTTSGRFAYSIFESLETSPKRWDFGMRGDKAFRIYDSTRSTTVLYFDETSGGANFAGNVGFNGTTAIAKPTITGSRGGNAALASLLTALANYGLITDSTTA